MRTFLLVVFAGLSFWGQGAALAAQDALVNVEDAKAYSQPSAGSLVIGRFELRQRIRVSDKAVDGWYRVRVVVDGKSKIGHIRAGDIVTAVQSRILRASGIQPTHHPVPKFTSSWLFDLDYELLANTIAGSLGLHLSPAWILEASVGRFSKSASTYEASGTRVGVFMENLVLRREGFRFAWKAGVSALAGTQVSVGSLVADTNSPPLGQAQLIHRVQLTPSMNFHWGPGYRLTLGSWETQGVGVVTKVELSSFFVAAGLGFDF